MYYSVFMRVILSFVTISDSVLNSLQKRTLTERLKPPKEGRSRVAD